jgi:ankyrin repeat protein
MMAAQSAKSDLVAYLLEHGAIAAAKDAQGKTALDYANKAQVDEYTIKSMPESKVDKAATIAILLKATGNKP